MKPILYFFVLAGLFACQLKKPNSDALLVPSIEENSAPDDFQIFTNPSAEKIIVVFSSPNPGRALLSIYYPDGKIFEQRQLTVNKGLNSWDCYCAITSTGVYVVKLTMDTIERSKSIFKTFS